MIPFADDVAVPGWALAVGALVTAVGGAVFGGVVSILSKYLPYRVKMREHDAMDKAAEVQFRKDEYEASLASWKDHANRLEEQNKRQETTMESYRVVMETLRAHDARCREVAAQQNQAIYFLYDALTRCHGALCAAGHDPGPLLKLPEMKALDEAGDTLDFTTRQLRHDTDLIKEENKKIAEHKEDLLKEEPRADPVSGKRPS